MNRELLEKLGWPPELIEAALSVAAKVEEGAVTTAPLQTEYIESASVSHIEMRVTEPNSATSYYIEKKRPAAQAS